jgi:hypothetical protein
VILAHNLVINFLSGCKDTTMAQRESTWEELLGLLCGDHIYKGKMTLTDYQAASDEKRKDDKDGPAWIPCSVLDTGTRRTKLNMDQAYLLVLDIDTGMALADVKARVAGYEAAIHSTYSHSPEVPKWRVVMPLRTPIPAAEIAKLFDFFQKRFDGLLDSACGHDPSRLYYLPGCPADAQHLFVWEHLEGELLNGAALLEGKEPALVALKALAAPVSAKSKASLSAGVSEGNRNNDIFQHACGLLEKGVSAEIVTLECLKRNRRNQPPLDEEEVKRAVKSAQRYVGRQGLATAASGDEIVDRLNSEYAWVEKVGRIYRFKFRDFVFFDNMRQQFANTGMKVNVGGSEKWLNHAEIWQRSAKRRTHDNVKFIPGAPAIVDNCINFWEGWGTAPAAGDINPWNEMLDYIFSGDVAMRHWFEQWLAYPIQHPGVKLTTAVVLWSGRQGVGKSMIGETIGKLYGSHFVTITSEVLHGAFTGWMRDCQFALGEENSSSSQREDANRLKILITGATVFVNEKQQPAFQMDNRMNFLFTSNHSDAFYLEDADRRFFIWEIVADRQPGEFYDRFIDWRDNTGGLAALMDYLLKFDLTGFLPKGTAPVTEAKREMIQQSKTDLERWLCDTTEDVASVMAVFGKEVVHLDELTKIYCRERSCRVTSTAVSRAFRRMGAHAKRRVVTKKKVRQNLISLINHQKWESADNDKWAAEYARPSPVRL